MQGGNTIAEICAGRHSLIIRLTTPGLVGLAADYDIVNANLSYDIAAFAPYHIIFGADYAKNIGYNKEAVNKVLRPLLRA